MRTASLILISALFLPSSLLGQATVKGRERLAADVHPKLALERVETNQAEVMKGRSKSKTIRAELNECTSISCRMQKKEDLAIQVGKNQGLEESLITAVDDYTESEEVYYQANQSYYNENRLIRIKNTYDNSPIRQRVASRGESEEEEAEATTGDVKTYKIASPELDGGREVDPRGHRAEEGTRDPGITRDQDSQESGTPMIAGGGGTATPRPTDSRTPLSQGRLPFGVMRESEASARGASARFGDTRETAKGRAGRRDAKNFAATGEQVLRGGDAASAREFAQKAIKADKKNPAGWLLKAKVFNEIAPSQTGIKRRSMFQDAERAGFKAANRDPNNGGIFRELAFSQLHLGKSKDAIQASSRAIFLNKNDAQAYALRAYAYEQLGDRKRMLDNLRIAASLDPARFQAQLQDAIGGKQLFDLKGGNNRQLLEALVAETNVEYNDNRQTVALGTGVLLLGLGAALLLWHRKNTASPTVKAAPADRLFAGRFMQGEEVAPGAMGRRWKAHDPKLRRDILIEAINDSHEGAGGRKELLANTVQLAKLSHPYLLSIYEVVNQPKGIYLVYEQISGKSLKKRIEIDGQLEVAEAVSILNSLCDALEHTHAGGVAHGRLHPDDVLCTEQGFVKLRNFDCRRMSSVETDIVALGNLFTTLTSRPHPGNVSSIQEFRSSLSQIAEAP